MAKSKTQSFEPSRRERASIRRYVGAEQSGKASAAGDWATAIEYLARVLVLAAGKATK